MSKKKEDFLITRITTLLKESNNLKEGSILVKEKEKLSLLYKSSTLYAYLFSLIQMATYTSPAQCSSVRIFCHEYF